MVQSFWKVRWELVPENASSVKYTDSHVITWTHGSTGWYTGAWRNRQSVLITECDTQPASTRCGNSDCSQLSGGRMTAVRLLRENYSFGTYADANIARSN